MTTTSTTTGATRHAWLTLVAMTGSLSMIMLDQTVVTVALPTMTRELPLTASGQQWVVNAYVLAMAAMVALGGKLGAKIGPVTTFRLGVTIFFVASAFCGLAPVGSFGEEWMIIARAVQGIGAALMMPASATIVMDAFPVSVRGRAMAVYVGISQIFLAIGPLLGGALTEWVTWRAVFWLNVPVGLLALVLVARAKPDNTRQPSLRIQPISAALMIAGLALSVYAIQQSSQWGWGSPTTLGLLAVGVVITGFFVWTQTRSDEPLVDVRLFVRKAFSGNLVVLFAVQFGLLAIVLFSTLYVQDLLGYSPIMAGVAALPLIIPIAVGAQLAGRWYDRSGVRGPVLTGLLIATVGVVLWALSLSRLEYGIQVPGMIIAGLGLGLIFSPVNTDALGRVTAADRAQASGIVQTIRQLGGTLGVAIIGAVVLAREHTGTVAAHHSLNPKAEILHSSADAIAVGFYGAAIALVLAAIAGWFLLSRERITDDVAGAPPAV
ncbi:MFS transporter [Gordonia sp. OPL2]|uniref:MFS transporter n=1 Tax=Gordonia sp. OPL2 TaxID=2486274 RepID=UPI0016553E69|nr:MFS transporter [Gordonia sp. OPL2]ROZ98243.1 DHA2 family efflux MFS transporter permease subunit [Gordonia sp. OPL2]